MRQLTIATRKPTSLTMRFVAKVAVPALLIVMTAGCGEIRPMVAPDGGDGGGAGDSGLDARTDAGLTMCGSSLVDLSTSPSHCGTCNNRCAGGASCSDGTCTCDAAGETACAGTCVNLSTNRNFCGSCAIACATSASCSAGACTCDTPGEVVCAGACVNLSTNRNFCGSCSTACATGASCSAGTCTCDTPGEVVCAGACVNLSTNRNFCGSCSTACVAGEEECVGGSCACIDADQDGRCGSADVCVGFDDRPDLNLDNAPDCSQSLLPNGQFTVDATHWSYSLQGSVTWRSADALDNAGSGSLRVTNRRTDTTRQISGHGVCIPINPDRTYTIWANYRVPTQSVADVRAGLGFLLFTGANCSGVFASGIASGFSDRLNGTDAWSAQSYSFSTVSDAVSAAILLTVDKPGSTGDGYADFDNVLLRPDPI